MASVGAALAIAGLASGELKQGSVSFTPAPIGEGTAKCAPGQQALAGGFYGPFQGLDPDDAATFALESTREGERGWRVRASSLGVPAAVDALVYCDRLGYGLERNTATSVVASRPISSVETSCNAAPAAVAGGFDLPDHEAAPLVSKRQERDSWIVRTAIPPGKTFGASVYCDQLDPDLRARERTQPVPAGQTSSVTAQCRQSEELRSGGFEIESSEAEGNTGLVHGSRRSGNRGWEVLGFATKGTPQLTAYAYCRKQARPKVVQLSYAGSSLLAFPCHTDTLSFTTKYDGRRASAAAELSGVSDSDLDRNCNRGWRPIRKNVVRLVKESLDERGVAEVRTRAKRGSRVDSHRWRIVLAQCAPASALYPADCEVSRSGEHVRLRG